MKSVKKGPSLLTLVGIIFVLIVAYNMIVWAVTNRGVRVKNTEYSIDQLSGDYEIPRIVKSNDAKYEFTSGGYIHIYNSVSEVLIDLDGEKADILQYIDRSNKLIDEELQSKLNEELNPKDYEDIVARRYTAENTENGKEAVSVSFKYKEISYGLVLIDPDSDDYVVSNVKDMLGLDEQN